MLLRRECQQCGREFQGGPRAFFCPSCRASRSQQAQAAYRQRKRQGDVRPLGSTDQCIQCGHTYIVQGGLQRYCDTCRPEHNRTYDRETSIAFYHEHKQAINPTRNAKRRKGPRRCPQCGTEITGQPPPTKYCSDACRRAAINASWRARYHARRAVQPPAHDQPDKGAGK